MAQSWLRSKAPDNSNPSGRKIVRARRPPETTASSTVQQHHPHSIRPSASSSSSTDPQPIHHTSTPPVVDTATSTLVDFQDCIILEATKIAIDGDQDAGNLIIDKVCNDTCAQRVVGAHHRQNKSVEDVMQGLKALYTPTPP